MPRVAPWPSFVAALWLLHALTVSGAEPEFFDPDGYYAPAGDITVSGYRLASLHVRTLEYFYDGALHHDKPRFVVPSARLVLERQSDGTRATYECLEPTLGREALAVVCQAEPIGVVSIRGTFLDKRGQFWNQADVAPHKTVVAVVTVTVTREATAQVFRDVGLTYRQDD